MCTVAIYFQEFSEVPLIVAANRDEHFIRPSGDPQILGDQPWVFGGKDLRAGGTWLGINSHGLIVGTVNRRKEGEEPNSHLRSRGLLCLEILRLKSPLEAQRRLSEERGSDYQPFTLFYANAEEAYASYNVENSIESVKLERGLHVISNTSLYDPRSEKMDQAYSLFSNAKETFREKSPTRSWVTFLQSALSFHASERHPRTPKDGICVHGEDYGTVSSSIIFRNHEGSRDRFFYYHASGPPCRESFRQVWPQEAS